MFKSTFLTLIICLLVLSCVEQKSLPISDPINFGAALEVYNKTKASSQHEGIIINGNVKVIKYTEGKEIKLVFLVTGTDTYRKYQFQYDVAQDEVDLPESITNGQVVYLGDNLILFDPENQQYHSFVIEGYENRTPQLTPKLGIGLISVIFDNGNSLSQSFASCSCGCSQCLSCEFNCGTASASCNCGGNSQSVSCRQCYNASCTPCGGDK